MASFYLNVRDGEELISDPDAYQFPSARAAREATVKIVREMLRGHAADFDNKQIEIADATGHPISIVSIHDILPERIH